MTSLLLRTATRYLQPLLILFSIFLLVRGHNEPGGGFVGGLMAAAAFILCAIAYQVPAAWEMLRVDPRGLIGSGLLLALASGLFSMLADRPFLTGIWDEFSVPGLGKLPIGTPFLFDVGVYLVVLGVTLTIILTLAEE